MTQTRVDLDRRPMLVFWETTRACLLACRHCRASAISEPLPGQLTFAEGRRLLQSLAEFGRPYPVLVLTGGDPLMRPDLLELVRLARGLELPVAVSPAVTALLDPPLLGSLRASGVKVVSISLDGARATTHEQLRGVEGHFQTTVAAIDRLREHRFTVQVNTVVRPENVYELPELAAIVAEHGAAIWEAFFLIHVGRGNDLPELSPDQNEDVCHFLFDASQYGFIVRTVEAPFFRRVVTQRLQGQPPPTSTLYRHLSTRLRERLGKPISTPRAQTKGTRDGKGIIFIAHNGDIYPSGFLPLPLGNVKHDNLTRTYRDHPLLRAIRAGRFHGRCAACEHTQLCGGSRARAYAATTNPLAEDPACNHQPAHGPAPVATRATLDRNPEAI